MAARSSPRSKGASATRKPPSTVTGINFPVALLTRLAHVASKRKELRGGRGRASVSDLVVEIVQSQLDAIEARTDRELSELRRGR